MNHAKDSFINAYGIELGDVRHLDDRLSQDQAPYGNHRSNSAEQPGRSKRVDQPARVLRGPHFDARAVDAGSQQQSDETNRFDATAAWDAGAIVVDMNFGSGNAAADQEPLTVANREATGARPADTGKLPANTATLPTDAGTLAANRSDEQPIDPEVLDRGAESDQGSLEKLRGHSITRQPETAEATVAEGGAESQAVWTPAWEVDQFCWPEAIEALFEHQAGYFDYAGKKLHSASQEGLKVLAVTSARSGEGATTMAMCLARAAATAGAKVVLLDGNLHNPELGDRLGIDFACGWQAAASGEVPLAEAAVAGIEENITLLASVKETNGVVRSFGEPCVAMLLSQALAGFDLLIVDAGQEELADNTNLIDGAIVVRDVRSTPEQRTLNMAIALKDHGVKAVGVAENFGDSKPPQVAAAA